MPSVAALHDQTRAQLGEQMLAGFEWQGPETGRKVGDLKKALVKGVELEGLCSNPGLKFKQLVAKWRSLPATSEPSPTRQRRQPQRVEDRLGPETVAQLCADYEAGVPTTQLMRRYSIGKGSVLRLLEANGVPRQRQGLSTEQAAEAVRLYRQGWSSLMIGHHFGKDHGVILRVLERAGVARRDSHGRSQ